MSKSQFIQIRVSEEEKRELQEEARKAGIPLAQWIRGACKREWGMAWPLEPITPQMKAAAADLERIRVRLPDAIFKTTPIPKLYPKHPASRIKRGRPPLVDLSGFQEHLNDGSPLPVNARVYLSSKQKAKSRPKTSERLRSMREGKK